MQEIFCHSWAQSVLTAAALRKTIEHFNMRLSTMYMPPGTFVRSNFCKVHNPSYLA